MHFFTIFNEKVDKNDGVCNISAPYSKVCGVFTCHMYSCVQRKGYCVASPESTNTNFHTFANLYFIFLCGCNQGEGLKDECILCTVNQRCDCVR